MNPSPAPQDVRVALAEQLGPPDLERDIAADRIAFAEIEHIAAARCHRDALSQQALETCGLLHAAGNERGETGYFPEDTISEAVAKGSEVHRQRGHAARLLERRGGEMAR